MIKDQLFIDLADHIDLEEFDKLHPFICRSMALASHVAIYGLQVYHPGTVHPLAQGLEIKPLSQVHTHWDSLAEDHPLKIAGKDLSYNQLTTFLKFSLQAYDHYIVYKVLDENYKYSGVGEVGMYFPELITWIEQLIPKGIFKSLHSATIMALDAGGIPWEHHDPEDPLTTIFDPDIPEEAVSGQITEFIHIKTDCDRPFYVIDPTTKDKKYITTRVAWWDERDWHGGEPINRPTYTVRVNGRFTDEFKKSIKVEGYDACS
jgi:hypothetical protein